MNQALILYPLVALVGWTLLVLPLIGFRRLTSRLHPKEFALGESAAVPARVSLPNRNFMNLLEVPVLFYMVCIVYFLTASATPAVVNLAWAFVALRVGHTLVHLIYNNVLHRLAFFALGNFVLVAMWIMLVLRLKG